MLLLLFLLLPLLLFKVLHSVKGNYEKTMEVNNKLKVNVDEQQDDIKDLKEQCNKDDKDKVQEISGAVTSMKKKIPVCVICNKSL